MLGVVALGVFDGVHRGHRALIAAAAQDARARGVACVGITFDPDPADVLAPPVPLSHLLETPDRINLMRQAGADEVICLDFSPELASTEWREFACDVLCAQVEPVAVHVGANFRFGRGGTGGVAELASLGDELGFDVVAHDLLELGGKPVSSTRIRYLLREGRVGAAGELLGRAHVVRGQVERGRGEGTGMGFPTANVVSDPLDCMPAEGVYAGWVVVDDVAWPAAINVGSPRSFDSSDRPSFLEANLMGYAGDLYTRDVVVAFSAWLRPARTFDDIAELERVVEGNISWVRDHLGETGVSLGTDGLWQLSSEVTDAELELV